MGNIFPVQKCDFANFILNNFLTQTEKDMADPFHNMTPALQEVKNILPNLYLCVENNLKK